METTMSPSVAEDSFAFRRWTVESKLDLPLWVKLQHAGPEQFFNVLLTLDGPVTPETVEELEAAGIELSDFHREKPSSPMPGKVSQQKLVAEVIKIGQIRHIEGVLTTTPS